MRKGQVVFTYFHFAASEPLTQAVINSGIVAIAYETVQLPSGDLPLLTPMSEVAGRMAVQEGAKYLEKVYAGADIARGRPRGIARGSPGHRGAWWVPTRRRCGRPRRARHAARPVARSLRYLADVLPSNVDLLYSNRYNLLDQLRRADLVIGAVLLPGPRRRSWCGATT